MPNNGNAPSPRTFPSMIFYKNALYVYGYIAFVEDNEDYVFKYDLVEESWEILNTFGDVPEPRSHHISYVHNDQMLVLYGYYLEENRFYNELYLFNLITYSWVKVSNFTGYPVIGASRVKVGNKIYLLFGRFFDEPTNFIQFLDHL
jgi:N-acetylneuraminic acid mutarotase